MAAELAAKGEVETLCSTTTRCQRRGDGQLYLYEKVSRVVLHNGQRDQVRVDPNRPVLTPRRHTRLRWSDVES